MKIIKLTNETKQDILSSLLKRSPNNYSQYEKTVADIIENVRNNKDEAVCAYTKQFDGFDLNSQNIRVTEEDIADAILEMDPEFIAVMEKSAKNIREYHEKQKRNSWFDAKEDGTILGQKVTPLEKVGIYVPGGKAAYPSSVLMNAIPAKLAAPKTSRIVAILQRARVKPIPIPSPSRADFITVFLLANISALPRMMQFTTISAI